MSDPAVKLSQLRKRKLLHERISAPLFKDLDDFVVAVEDEMRPHRNSRRKILAGPLEGKNGRPIVDDLIEAVMNGDDLAEVAR